MPVRKIVHLQDPVRLDAFQYSFQNVKAEMIQVNRYVQRVPVFFEKQKTG
jgi:hypothetical protein